MITNTGLNLVRNFLAGTDPTPPSHMAVGTSATASTPTDTALGGESHRNALTSVVGTSIGVVDYVMTLSSADANGNTLKEVGVLNAASSGDLILRETHASYTKTSDFSVKYKIRHTITRGV